MTCPNCGATLERHAFTHVCSYCGYVSATNEELQYGESEEINNSYYEYISNNLATIKQSPFVDIVQKQDCFECLSSKNFYPNDGHYMLDKKLSFLWHAKVTKQGICFNLLVKSEHTDAQNYICIKVREDVFTFKQQGEISNMLALCSYSKVLILAMMPVVSLPTTVITVLSIIRNPFRTANLRKTRCRKLQRVFGSGSQD